MADIATRAQAAEILGVTSVIDRPQECITVSEVRQFGGNDDLLSNYKSAKELVNIDDIAKKGIEGIVELNATDIINFGQHYVTINIYFEVYRINASGGIDDSIGKHMIGLSRSEVNPNETTIYNNLNLSFPESWEGYKAGITIDRIQIDTNEDGYDKNGIFSTFNIGGAEGPAYQGTNVSANDVADFPIIAHFTYENDWKHIMFDFICLRIN